MFKKFFTFTAIVLAALPMVASAITVPWNRPSVGLIHPLYVSDRVLIGSSTVATSTDSEKLRVNGDAGIDNYFFVGPFAYDGISSGLDGTFDPEYFIADFTAAEGTNHYTAVSFNNFNNGTSSSIDLTFNNDLTSDIDGDGEFSYYGDIGLNSSQYNTPFYGYQNTPNMLYMYMKDGPLSFASVSPTSTVSYIQFLTGNNWSSEAARITHSGAMGIGSTSPGARLVITNPLSTNSVIVEDQATDTTPFVIDANGGVGIGTSTPVSAKLSIKCNGNSTGLCIYSNNSSGFEVFRQLDSGSAIFGREVTQLTATPVKVSFGGSYGNSTPGNQANLKWCLYCDGTAASSYGIGMTASLMALQAGSTGAIGFYVNNGTHRATFNSTGAGFGTTTPQTGLHVSGADTASRMQLAVQSTGTSGGISLWNSSDTRVGYLYFTATELQLSRSSRAFTIDNQFYITSGGIVGIGTTTPAGGLTVANGNIRNIANDATGVLQTTLSSGFSGFNMQLETGTLAASFQLGNSNTGIAQLRNAFFMGPRLSNNNFYFVQGAAATIAGGFDSSQSFFWGTSTQTVANSKFTVYTTATTTLSVDSNHASRGGCIAVKDSDGSGYTYITYNDGVQTVSTTSCI